MLQVVPNSMFAPPAAPRVEDPAAQWLRWAVIQWKYPEGLPVLGKVNAVPEPVTIPNPCEEETERAGV